MRTTLCACFGSVLLLTSCILPTRFSEPGPYIAGSVMGAADNFDDLDPSEDNDDDTVAGLGVRAGYRVLPWLSGELAYEYMDEFDVRVAEVGLQSLVLQGKFNPLAGRFQPYAMAGIGYLDADVDPGDQEGDMAYRGGLGIDFYVIQKVALFAELAYTVPQDDLDDLEYYTASLGAIWKF